MVMLGLLIVGREETLLRCEYLLARPLTGRSPSLLTLSCRKGRIMCPPHSKIEDFDTMLG